MQNGKLPGCDELLAFTRESARNRAGVVNMPELESPHNCALTSRPGQADKFPGDFLLAACSSRRS
jgi:hypothetical protein